MKNSPLAKRHADGDDQYARGEGNEERRRPLKRTRTNGTITTSTSLNFIPTRRGGGSGFLFLHLQILRTLYDIPLDGKSCDDNSMNGTMPEDDKVDNNLWETIRKFLRERKKLKSMAKRVDHYQGVHDEALEFMKDKGQGNETIPFYWSGKRANFLGALSNSNNNSQVSPFSRHHHSRYSSSLLLSGPDDNFGDAGAFGLIAGLLKEKLQVAKDDLKRTTSPFQPLLKEVERRIQSLQQFANMYNNNLDGDNVDRFKAAIDGVSNKFIAPFQEADEEVSTRIETKLRLWRMLLSDLK